MNRAHYLLQELGAQLRNLPQGATYPGRILIVDEEGEQYGKPLAAILPECRVIIEANPEAARRYFLSSPTDLVILNHSPRISCLELLPDFKSLRPSVSVIVVTGCGSEEMAVQVFRHGAIDYFRKPFEINALELTVRAALEFQRKRKERKAPQPLTGIQRALRYIEAKFNEPISLNQAAREASMSISCFERRLKKQTGMTFTGFVNALRVAKAKEMIKKENCSMLQVSITCGFSNQSHFNRTFKQFTKMSPLAFRKSAGF